LAFVLSLLIALLGFGGSISRGRHV
jgi:hypothetical protein